VNLLRLFVFTLLFVRVVFAQEDVLYPLTNGSSWTYNVIAKKNYTVTNKIVEEKLIDGVKWYKLHEYDSILWVRNNKLGQVEAANYFGKETPPLEKAQEVVAFKFPVKLGDTWEYNGAIVTYKGIERMEVPAGIFECHVYYIDLGDDFYDKLCIAKDIGIVYNEEIVEDNDKEISKLIKYEIKEK
jgi:hypothetical protein